MMTALNNLIVAHLSSCCLNCMYNEWLVCTTCCRGHTKQSSTMTVVNYIQGGAHGCYYKKKSVAHRPVPDISYCWLLASSTYALCKVCSARVVTCHAANRKKHAPICYLSCHPHQPSKEVKTDNKLFQLNKIHMHMTPFIHAHVHTSTLTLCTHIFKCTSTVSWYILVTLTITWERLHYTPTIETIIHQSAYPHRSEDWQFTPALSFV